MTSSSTLVAVPQLCMVRPQAVDGPSLLRLMAGVAREHGWVTDGFAEALVGREREFPTGLPTPVPVAIPHADPVHVLRPGLAVALLDPPVAFGQMGSDEEVVDCRLAVMLLVTDPSEQVAVLNRLVTALQDPTLESRLSTVSSPQDLAATFGELIG